MAAKRKLTDANLGGIRYLAEVEKVSLRQIAEVYGVSHVQIWRVLNKIQRQNKLEPKV